MFDEVLQYFLGLQGGSYDRVWHDMKFINLYALVFKEFAYYFDTANIVGKHAYA